MTLPAVDQNQNKNTRGISVILSMLRNLTKENLGCKFMACILSPGTCLTKFCYSEMMNQAGGDSWLLGIIWQWPLRERPRLVTSSLNSTAPLPPGLAFQ